jgi:hypothetical protein
MKNGICQFTLDGKLIRIFSSNKEAVKETNIPYKGISNNCTGRYKSSGVTFGNMKEM